MKILLVYPKYPETFWSFSYALKFVSKRASFPPLGLLTVAAMLPDDWERKLVDMNVTNLTDKDISWADYVFISAMTVQRKSAEDAIRKCHRLNTKVVAGGPLFTTGHEEFTGVDHFVLGEAEASLSPFLEDLSHGNAKAIYPAPEWPDINKTPLPMWSLINIKNYSSMNIQYSRGCPFNCEFCDIIVLNGHKPRTKDKGQVIDELESLYQHGWRGGVFFVDDNFIGNKRKLKEEILPALVKWSRSRKYPFAFYTEASINLADDEELMSLMTEAGFDRLFIGIETPNEESLIECNKMQNTGRDLIASVKKLQNRGFEVQGGFIVGFDNDPASIFKSQINFIQNSGIVTAMVGLLNAPRGTRLHQRLQKENRLLKDMSGDNTDFTLNFIPKMNRTTLIKGYEQIVKTIYAPKQYYERVWTFIKEYQPRKPRGALNIQSHHVKAFFKSLWVLGIKEKGKRYFWKLIIATLLKYPRSFHLSIGLSIFGYHFRKVANKLDEVKVEDVIASR